MKNEDLFKYQKDAMRLLTSGFEKDKLVHAYLLDGNPGCGSLDAAIYMAKKLLCEKQNAPCMNCGDCKKIDSHTHLNVLFIHPDGDVIKKEQIENLIKDFSLTSFNGKPQIYIITQADKMNASAQNALLKFLEEPNPNHYAFLITSNYKRLLDTIVSRCQFIHFKPIPKQYLMSKLIDYGVEKDIAYIVSHLTSEVDVAMKYIEEGKITNFMLVAKKIVDKDLKQKDVYVEYYRNKVIFIEEKDKFYHRLFLDILILIYQEILLKMITSKNEYFDDILENVKFKDIKINDIIRKLDLLNTYQERFNYYVNLDLQYTSLFSKL